MFSQSHVVAKQRLTTYNWENIIFRNMDLGTIFSPKTEDEKKRRRRRRMKKKMMVGMLLVVPSWFKVLIVL